MDEYGFDTIGKGLGFTGEQITYAKMLIVERMVHPGSERKTERWLSETSGVGELLGNRAKPYDMALHRTAVLLWENHEAIEQEVSYFVLFSIISLGKSTYTFDSSQRTLSIHSGAISIFLPGNQLPVSTTIYLITHVLSSMRKSDTWPISPSIA